MKYDTFPPALLSGIDTEGKRWEDFYLLHDSAHFTVCVSSCSPLCAPWLHLVQSAGLREHPPRAGITLDEDLMKEEYLLILQGSP